MISKTIGCRGTRHFQTNPCIPRVYVIPVVGLAGGFYVQEEIDPRKTQKTHQGLCWLSEIDDSGSMFVLQSLGPRCYGAMDWQFLKNGG